MPRRDPITGTVPNYGYKPDPEHHFDADDVVLGAPHGRGAAPTRRCRGATERDECRSPFWRGGEAPA